jgi:hypothetical protein
VAGDYSRSSDKIRLTIDNLSPGEFQADLDHETFHALSGVTAKIEEPQPLPGERDLFIREGLAINEHTRGRQPLRKERFNWLNEAVTEELSIAIRSDKSGVYENERAILKLLENRVDPKLFYAAYFETFEQGEGTPAWGELQGALHEQFEPHILLTLDNIITDDTEHGLSRARNYLEDIFQPD